MYKLNLFELYKNTLVNKLKDKFKYKSIMQVPVINKIVLNTSIKNINMNKNNLDNCIKDMFYISNQKPFITKSKKSISNFKIRKNDNIGCKVTLRKFRMWIFIEKLIFIAIPRIRDFRGFSKKSFDSLGNYNFGIKEQTIFPEINMNINNFIFGMNISISIVSNNDNSSFELLKMLNFPFK